MSASELSFRTASEGDVFALMRVCQLDDQANAYDVLFSEHKAVLSNLRSADSLWIVAERKGEVEGFAWVLLDREQKLGKINRVYVNPAIAEGREACVRALVDSALERLANDSSELEVLYTSMRPLAYRRNLVQDAGFKTLGIFPNGKKMDNSVVNALAGYYFRETLQTARLAPVSMHKVLEPLYRIVAKECSLEMPTFKSYDEVTFNSQQAPPDLEIITAPQFVKARFNKLKKRQFLANPFYPFHEPNTLITNPDQTVEVFVKVMPEAGMAAIVGEHLDIDLDPVALASRIADLLHACGLSYIEVINEASDVVGTEAILRAGYLPCAYFPALKRQAHGRRDYVVFARSFENFRYPDLGGIDGIYSDYLEQYSRLEAARFQRFR